MWRYTLLFTGWLLLLTALKGYAQDPALPATNLGMSNIQDGVSPGPGLYYVQYLQLYSPHRQAGPQVSSLLSMHQLIYESRVKVAKGNLALSVLLPVVKLSVNGDGKLPSVNPGVLGGLIFGPVIQWSGKKLWRKPYAHRVEVDLSVPVGSYSSRYDINPVSRFYTLTAYYAFTWSLTGDVSISARNNFNYNFRKMGTEVRTGMFYNVNYAAEYRLFKTFRAAVTGYYLQQLTQDAYAGNTRYYQDTYGIADTRERVLGIGPGISYVTAGGLALEGKVFFETAGKNRPEGVRPTLRVAYKIK